MPGFEAVLRASLGRLQDAVAMQRLLGKAVPAAAHAPALALSWQQVQDTLDAPEAIPLLISPDEAINGFTLGLRSPHVVLTEGARRQLPALQQRAILAHELGHVLSGHVLYKTLVRMLDAGRWWLGAGGLNLVLTVPILLALHEWDRKSELSADRAELLVVGDLDACVLLLERSHLGQQEEALRRREQISRWWKPGGQALAALDRAFARHPPLEERKDELRRWARSEELAAIRAGRYPRRQDQPRPADVEERVAALGEGLKAQLEEAQRKGNAVIAWLVARTGGGEG